MKNQSVTRRDAVKKIIRLSGGILMAGSAPLLFPPKQGVAGVATDGWIVEGLGRQPGYSVKKPGACNVLSPEEMWWS